MKPRHLVLGAALLGAAALVAFGNREPRADIAEAVERAPAPAPARTATRTTVTPAPRAPLAAPRTDMTAGEGAAAGRPDPAKGEKGQPILALVPRELLIGDSDTQFGQGENGAAANGKGVLFGHQDWTPPPPPPAPAPPPPPPTAPPLPFTFIGKSVADGAWEVYLARGERTYVVHDKEVIDGMYRVDAIAPPVMTLTYLPLKQIQQLNIGVFD